VSDRGALAMGNVRELQGPRELVLGCFLDMG
jgi:hypothetical protein